MRRLSPPALIAFLAAAAGLSACQGSPPHASIGDAERGRVLIGQIGCGSCHAIPGVAGANGMVGPPLKGVGERTIIAGVLPNTPDNMIRWLEAPQSVVPGNAMPNMELTQNDAKDIAAYLYAAH